MLLKNQMEDKQLDFNQPLLSVRRFSSTVGSEKDAKKKTDYSLPSIPPLPSYRSELKSGPVSNPGTVPFTWEQSPGRPKDERKLPNQPPIIPKLPPGRIMEVKQHEDSQSVSSVEERVAKLEKCKDEVKEEEGSDSGDGDDAYVDALDTLSRTESYFLNCSLSGLSELDSPEVRAKPSGTFSTDPQTRDFMMGRFLPAAKAMTSETPQYAIWKQPVVKETPRQLREVISGDKRPPLNRPRPYVLPNYPEYHEEETDDEDDEYGEPGNFSTKVCGLLPRFCLKSSLCLLNPVQGMSVRTRGRYSSSGSCQETKNERTRDATHEQRSIGRPHKTEIREYRNVMGNKHIQVPHPSSYQKLERSSLYKRLQGSSISQQQSESPQSSSYEEKVLPDIPKETQLDEITSFGSQKKSPTTFQELLADQSTEGEIDSASPMVEKTLYVDSVHKVVSPMLSSLSSNTKELPNSMCNVSEIVAKDRGSEETPSVDSLLEDTRKSNTMNEEVVLQIKSSKPVDSSIQSFPGKSDQEMGMEMPKGIGQHDQELCQESITSANLKLSHGYLDYEDQQQLTEVENVEDSLEINSQFPIAPPLPKSPSESWLWRTLPSMSTRNSSSRSYLVTRMHPQDQASKIPSVDPKWETIVKTTN